MLKVDSLSAAYDNRQVLRNVSFMLPSGKILGLIGPNGAGKTTLVRAISGAIPLKSGCVEVMGQNLSSLNQAERARLIAVVPQARQLPPAFSGWETVLLGRTPYLNWLGQLSERDNSLTRQAMERTSTFDLSERRVGELSGGEQQRLLLARALNQAAPVLLLDEPTTHLDLQFQINLLQLVHNLSRQDNLTVLVALHDLNLVARFADMVGLLVDGALIALGAPEEVLTPELLSEAYHVPLEVLRSANSGHAVIIPSD
jgi:iron complex transport system ATP-binding protein